MASFKFVFAILCAFALGSQAATVPHTPKTLGDVIENVIKIVDIIISAVQKGINDADPLLDAINAELNPALGDMIVEIRDDMKDVVNNAMTRMQLLEGEVTDALATIRRNIQPCLDAAVTTIDPVLDAAEGEIAVAFEQVQTDNREDINDLNNNVNIIFADLHQIIDTAIAASLECVVPGSADVKICLDTKISELINGLKKFLVNGALVVTQAKDVISIIAQQGGAAVNPIVNATIENLQGPLTTFGTCVTNTKPVKLY